MSIDTYQEETIALMR